MKIIFSILCVAPVTDCSSTNVDGDKPVRYAKSIPSSSINNPTFDVLAKNKLCRII